MTRKGKLHSINTGRRRLIRGVAAGAGLASIAYITNRGIRFPRLTLSPPEPASSLETALARFEIDGAIFTNNGTSNGPMMEPTRPSPSCVQYSQNPL